MKKFTTRILPINLLVMLCFSFQSHAQQRQILETQSYVGHLVRITPALADIDKTTMYGKPLVTTRDMNGIIGVGRRMEEVEEKLEERFARINPGKAPEAIQKPGTIFPNVPGTSIINQWAGQTSPGLQPTDNNMAAGPNHVIQIVNNTQGSQFTIYSKTGAVIAGPTILATVTGFPGLGDPIVLYDQLADRWLMVEFGPSAPTHNLNIAVSVTPNPTGAWKIYQYQDLSFFIDYHKFSVWHNAYYATSNDFNNAGSSYLGSSVYSMDRAAMIAGAPTAVMIRTRLNDGGQNYYNMGTIGLEGMTTSTQNGLFALPTAPGTLRIFEVTPNFAAATQAIGPETSIPVAAYSQPPNTVPQQGGGAVGTLGSRFMFKLNYRNNNGTESVVITHTVNNGSGGAAVRWYELRYVASAWTLFQQGTITGSDGNSRWMGGISMDGCGNIALMYDVSGATANPSMRYTGRNASDPLGQMTLPETVIINGTTNFNGSRWGDYNTTVQDYTAPGVPNNGSFWSTSQHSNQQTRIANYTLTGGCVASPNITAGTATLTAEGCVPNNSVIDPGETVTVNFCALNVGTANTTNLVGTMQVSGGVTPISGPQNYGVLTFGGPAVCRSFTFSNTSGTCGGTITVTIQWQDGATNLGSSSWTFTLGVLGTVLLPNGGFETGTFPPWVIGASNPAPVINTTAPHSGTRAAFLGNLPGPEPNGDASIYQTITVPAGGGILSFWWQGFTTDGIAFDWQDARIYDATGATLLATIMHVCQTSAYAQVNYNMAAFAGQTVRVLFLVHQDGFGDVTNMYVDDVAISNYTCCGAVCTITCPANLTVNTGPSATTCGANVTFPAATTTGLCGAITYSPANGSFFPKGTTTVTATTAAGPSCTFTVTVNDNTPPTITCPANIQVNNTPNFCSAVVNYALPTVTDNCGLPGPMTLTQTASQTPTAGSVACNSGGFHTLNSYWRAYNLAPMGLPGPIQVNSVQFGIELADANGTGTTQPVTVNVYTSAGAFPGGVRTLVGTSGVIQIPDQTLTTFTAPITVPPTVPANAILVLELQTPDGRAPVNNKFFIGSNASAQTGPSYISAADCGIATPTDLATLGFPNMHIILNAIGQITGPSPLVQIAGLASGATYPVGVTTNTFRATDIAGNTSTCSFTVTVVDNQAPSLTCPANIVQNTDASQCYATVNTPNPPISDNCAVTTLTWTITPPTGPVINSPATGINYVGSRQFTLNGTTGQGISTVTYTAKDAAGNTTTCSFTVTVNDAAMPSITGQPTNQFVCVGSAGAFTVTGSVPAGNPLTYQWQKWNNATSTWGDIAGATSATYTISAVQFSDNTSDYRCILTGRCSVVTSNYATLYVNPLPTISLLASRPLALLPGNTLTLTAVVSPGNGSYQWNKNGTAIAGATGSTLADLTVDNIGTYTCTYTDANGCKKTSDPMTVTGQPSDKIWLYPDPNFGIFQIRFNNAANEAVKVSILNSVGQQVLSQALISSGITYSKIDINISNLSAGEYNAMIINSAGKVVGTRKFVMVKQ